MTARGLTEPYRALDVIEIVEYGTLPGLRAPVPSWSAPAAAILPVACVDMESIVAKRTSGRYSNEAVWIKVKHLGYSQMEARWELSARSSA